MPLVICALFFTVLFSLEGFCFISERIRQSKALSRYQAVEHPRRRTSDRYLDLLG